jgi:hypothetical protein
MELHAVKTWYDQRVGVVSVEDDVLSIVRQVREIDPRIHIYYNEQTGKYDLVEHCLDGVERLIFSVSELDPRVLSRLREGDSWLDGNPDHVVPDEDDFLTKVEQDQEQLQAGIEAQSLEKVSEAGERLAWALDIAGASYGSSISVPKEIGENHGNDSERV